MDTSTLIQPIADGAVARPNDCFAQFCCPACGKPLKARSKWLSSAPAYLIECDPHIAQAVYEAIQQRLEDGDAFA